MFLKFKSKKSEVSSANKRSTILENNKFVLNDSNLGNLARKSKQKFCRAYCFFGSRKGFAAVSSQFYIVPY